MAKHGDNPQGYQETMSPWVWIPLLLVAFILCLAPAWIAIAMLF